MNSVTLIGNLTKDPELKERNDVKVCDLRVAENDGRDETPLFIDVSVFRRQAEVCEKYLSKGRRVAVTGRLRFSEWKAKDGSKRSRHTIVADRVDFIGGDQPEGGKGSGRDGGRDRDPDPELDF
jgi:single-strand DNA-binding protein